MKRDRLAIPLCGLAATVDGIDAQAMALAAPLVVRDWALPPLALGFVLGAAPLGMVLGSLVIAPMSDRIGRKPVLVFSLLWLGLFSLLLAVAGSVPFMAAMRLLAGIGMGAAVATVMALTADLSSPARRSVNVAIVFSGVPFGALLAAVIAVLLPDSVGWRGMFLLFGSLPVILAPIIAFGLPAERLRPASLRGASTSLSMRRLFARGHGSATLSLWLGIALAYQVTYFVVLWLPTLLAGAGLPLKTSMATLIALNAGAIIGGLGLAALMRHASPRKVVTGTFAISSVAAVAAAVSTGAVAPLLIALFFLGLLTLGGQMALGGLVAALYPADIRGAGVGGATGAGRLGAVSGPLLGAQLVALGYTAGLIMLVIAGLQLLVVICLWVGTARPFDETHEQ